MAHLIFSVAWCFTICIFASRPGKFSQVIYFLFIKVYIKIFMRIMEGKQFFYILLWNCMNSKHVIVGCLWKDAATADGYALRMCRQISQTLTLRRVNVYILTLKLCNVNADKSVKLSTWATWMEECYSSALLSVCFFPTKTRWCLYVCILFFVLFWILQKKKNELRYQQRNATEKTNK